MRHARLNSYSEATRTGPRGATDKGHGVVTQGRHLSKPLRSWTRRRSVACLPAGTGAAKTAMGPWCQPADISNNTARLSPWPCPPQPLPQQLGWSRTENALIKFAVDTKPEGLLIERMAESRFKNFLTGWNNGLKTCKRDKCKFLHLGFKKIKVS